MEYFEFIDTLGRYCTDGNKSVSDVMRYKKEGIEYEGVIYRVTNDNDILHYLRNTYDPQKVATTIIRAGGDWVAF